MDVFSKGNIQDINGLISVGNKLIQINNDKYFENENIIDDYFKKYFADIDELLQKGQISKIEKKLKEIDLKKQDRFTEKIESKLLKYKGIVALYNDNNDELNCIIKLLEKYKDNQEELNSLKFIIAINKKDQSLFDELNAIWSKELKEESLYENEMIYLYNTEQYNILINKFEGYASNSDNNNMKILLAQSYSCINEFDKAEEIFKLIKDIDVMIKFEYILHRSRYIYSNLNKLTDNEENIFLNELINNIDKLDFNKLKAYQYKQIVLIKMQTLKLLDCRKALEYYEEIKSQFQNDYEVTIVLADIFDMNREFNKAEKIYESLIGKENNEQIIFRLLAIKSNLNKWNDVINIFEKYKDILKDSNFFCRYTYGIALIECNKREQAEMIETDDTKELSLLLEARIYENSPEKCIMCLRKITKLVSKNDFILLNVTQVYEDLGRYDEACGVLYEGCKERIELYRKFIDIVIKNNLENYYDYLIKVYRKVYKEKNNEFIDERIYSLYIREKNYRGAYSIVEKLYNYKKNLRWTNEFLKIKLNNNEFSYIEDMVKSLESSNVSKYLITSAEVYSVLNNFVKAKELCYKAVYYLEDMDSEVLIRINSIKLRNYNNEFLKEKEEDKNKTVQLDDIVTIADNFGEAITICLNKEIYYQSGKKRFDILHIKNIDELWISTIGKRVNDKIFIGCKEYVIKSIINKFSYIFSIAFREAIKVNRQYIKEFHISSENDTLDQLKEQLRNLNENNRERIKMYMGEKQNVICPIYWISNEKDKIDSLIDNLLFEKEFRYMAGDPKIISKGSKVVLTLISTIFLAKFNMLKDFMEYYDVYIGEHLKKEISSILDNYIYNYNQTELSVCLIEDKLYRDEKDYKYKKVKIDFYRSILLELKKATTINKKIFYESELINASEEFLKSEDIEAVEIAKDIKGTIFVDDMFTQKIFYEYCEDISISNLAGFVNAYLFKNYKKYMKILETLIQGKYLFVFNYESLLNIILNFKILKTSDLNHFRKFIELIINNDVNGFYKDVIKDICLRFTFIGKVYSLYKTKIDVMSKYIY